MTARGLLAMTARDLLAMTTFYVYFSVKVSIWIFLQNNSYNNLQSLDTEDAYLLFARNSDCNLKQGEDCMNAAVKNKKLNDWIKEVADMCQPDDIYLCSGDQGRI